jgi:hypothetical protein
VFLLGLIVNADAEQFAGRRAAMILAKHSFRRSSSERTCNSMAVCSAAVPLLENSAEAFLSRFCFQSRIACLAAVWASDAALRYVFMQASAVEHVLHSWAAAALETSKASVAVRTFIVFPLPIRTRRPADFFARGPAVKSLVAQDDKSGDRGRHLEDDRADR